nr:MAG TPA: hypothetical protein [Caudoviricetes sp.]
MERIAIYEIKKPLRLHPERLTINQGLTVR